MQAFRHSMRRLAGGVALITTSDGQRRYGMTMTAVMSLSLEPPSLVIAVNHSASIAPVLQRDRGFCVNLLKHASADMCRTFSALPSDQRFDVGDWTEAPNGAPYLDDAQAVICCHVGPIHRFATHDLVIGLVSDAWGDEAISPLLHLDGRYLNANVG